MLACVSYGFGEENEGTLLNTSDLMLSAQGHRLHELMDNHENSWDQDFY